MRWKLPASAVLALALLIPAAPAMAQSGSPSPAATTCTTIAYADVRTLITIDLDTATDTEIRIQTGQILTVANAESLTTLAAAIQTALGGTPADLRAFLKTQVVPAWTTNLRILVVRTLGADGTNVHTAAQTALDDGTADALLTYLNDGWYLARARDAGAYKTYTDVRTLITIDLDTATDTEIRIQTGQILTVANAEGLTTLAAAIQTALGGTPDSLRTFLKSQVIKAWTTNLRVLTNQALAAGGTNVKNAAQVALDNGTTDALLAFLDHGVYLARAQDCAI